MTNHTTPETHLAWTVDRVYTLALRVHVASALLAAGLLTAPRAPLIPYGARPSCVLARESVQGAGGVTIRRPAEEPAR